ILLLQLTHQHPRSTLFPYTTLFRSVIYDLSNLYIQRGGRHHMPTIITSIRLDTRLADEAAKILGVKSRTEAIHVALKEIVALKRDRKSTRLNSSHQIISYAVFCLKK